MGKILIRYGQTLTFYGEMVRSRQAHWSPDLSNGHISDWERMSTVVTVKRQVEREGWSGNQVGILAFTAIIGVFDYSKVTISPGA